MPKRSLKIKTWPINEIVARDLRIETWPIESVIRAIRHAGPNSEGRTR